MSKKKYQDVIDWLINEIENGNYAEGEKIPSEFELAEKFNYSRQTIRRATDELVNNKYLSRIKGSGTYVGYRFRKKQYNTIAVVVTYVDNYIFPNTLKGLSDILTANGYSMSVYYTDDCVLKERENLKLLIADNHIDGLIIEPTKSALPSPNLDLYQKIIDMKLPMLFINAIYPHFNSPCIRINDQKIGEESVNYLFQQGHKKIGCIFQADDIQGHMRYKGFIKGLKKANLKFNQKQICWIDAVSYQTPNQLFSYFLSRLKGCTAVVCYNDFIAEKFIGFCKGQGIRIPEDLSIVGIDDADYSATLIPPLTTFRHPQYHLGELAAKSILKMIDNTNFDANYIFQSQLIIRESVINRKD